MVAKPQAQIYSLSGSCGHGYRSKYFCLMRLIQINNLRVFFKFRLLLWSLFNLQMNTHMYKFKPFPILFYLKQLSVFVFGHVGKQECRDVYIYLRI